MLPRSEQKEAGNQQNGAGDHHRRQKAQEDPIATRKTVLREGIACKRPENHVAEIGTEGSREPAERCRGSSSSPKGSGRSYRDPENGASRRHSLQAAREPCCRDRNRRKPGTSRTVPGIIIVAKRLRKILSRPGKRCFAKA